MRSLEKVSVLIVSWNGRHHLEHCLPCLETQSDPGVEVEVLVLDNGSRDGTAAWVSENYPKVRLISSSANLGFCGGNNRLVSEADGDAVVLLNNDTRPKPEWLAALVDALRTAPVDVAAASGMIVDWTGERLDFAGGVMTFDGHGFQRNFGRPLDEVEILPSGSELFFACGGNMIIWKTSFLEAGGFDESYFSYLEDVDLGWRLWQMGSRVVFAPEAVVHHRSMATSDLLGSSNRGFLFERNALFNVFKNYDAEHLRHLLPLVMLTANHRAQTMLVENNPGGFHLGLDPFAGYVADTAAMSSPVASAASSASGNGAEPSAPIDSTRQPRSALARIRDTYQYEGVRGVVRKAANRTALKILPNWMFEPRSAFDIRITDDQTIAQLRAIGQQSHNLDSTIRERSRVQSRRVRSDREIFERFPLCIVPTYPGDRRLFSSATFEALLDGEVAIDRIELDELITI